MSLVLAPAPRAVADAGPAPVENLTAETSIGLVTLHWTYPSDAEVEQAISCEQPGTVPLAAPTAYCLENNLETTGSTMRGMPPHRDYTYTVWSRDAAGNLGPGLSVTVLGSLTTMTTVPSGQGAVTDLRLAGHVVDSSSGAPLSGKQVEIYLGHRATATTYPEWNLVTRVTTDSRGNFARTFPLRPGLSYQARFPGAGTRMGNLSTLVPADGSTYIDLDTEDPWAGRSRKPRKVQLAARPGAAHRGDKVVFQRMKKGHWRQVAVRTVTSGRAVLNVKARTATTYRAVLSTPGRGTHPSFPLKVRRR